METIMQQISNQRIRNCNQIKGASQMGLGHRCTCRMNPLEMREPIQPVVTDVTETVENVTDQEQNQS
jgi:hypothetical protein